MKPETENGLVDVLDRLVNKGLILNADLIISVAGIPLIGINLKAALASIETMLDYGMMEAWDLKTREWYANELAKKTCAPLFENEEILLRTFGSLYYSQGIITTWRTGFWYLTNKRLFLWSKEPTQMFFETYLDQIESLSVSAETYLSKERQVVNLQVNCNKVVRIRVSEVAAFAEAIAKACEKKTCEASSSLLVTT